MKDIKDKPDFEFEAVSYANEWELNNWGDVKGKKLVDRSFRAGLKHAERIQKELERLQQNYDLQQGVLDSYRKRVEELEKLLKLERESNPNKAPF